jgi:hypothetical protein
LAARIDVDQSALRLIFYCCKVTRRCLPPVASGIETKAQGSAENLIRGGGPRWLDDDAAGQFR